MAKSANQYKKRVVFRIELSAVARDRLLGISDDLGITQIAITSQVMAWFAAQEDATQASILGLYPDVLKKDVRSLILEKMAK